MSTHVQLNLLNQLRKVLKCEDCRAFYSFSATNLIIQEHNVRFYLSYGIKITSKYYFWSEKVQILSHVCSKV